MNLNIDNAIIIIKLINGTINNVNKSLSSDYEFIIEKDKFYIKSEIKKCKITINTEKFTVKAFKNQLYETWNDTNRCCIICSEQRPLNTCCINCNNILCMECVIKICSSNNYIYKCPFCRLTLTKEDSISMICNVMEQAISYHGDNIHTKKVKEHIQNLKTLNNI
jgi:hypothetical protein